MSREDAAVYYLDGLLGFRGDFRMFHAAAETLDEKERSMLEHAVSGRTAVRGGGNEDFLGALNDNENQYQKYGGGRRE